MITFPKRLATGIAALVTAFAFMVGGFVGQPAANAVPADSYAPTIVDECGTENDSITFPTMLGEQSVQLITVSGDTFTPGTTYKPLPEMIRLNLASFGTLNYTVSLENGQEEGLSFAFSLNDAPCPPPAVPVKASLDSCDADTATVIVTGTHIGDVKATKVQAHGDHALGDAFPIPLKTLKASNYKVNVVLENGNFEPVSVTGDFSKCEAPKPGDDNEPGNTECVPNETGTVVDWEKIPAEYGDPAQTVDSAKVEYADGTTATLTPGATLEPGTRMITLYGVNGTILWDGCAPLDNGSTDPEEPDHECVPGETGVPAPWDKVPAVYDGKDVYYMTFINAAGTSYQLTPGLAIEDGAQVTGIYGAEDEELWNACDGDLVVEPEPDDPVLPVEDDVKLEAKDECGTDNDMYRVVGTTYEGREVIKVQMSGDYAVGEWIPYNADLVEMVGGVQVVLDNGNFAVIPFDLVFTDEPCEVTPEEPADDDSAQDPTDAATDDPAKDDGKKLPKTGVELTTFASLMALFGFAGAAGIAVARKRA